MSDNVGLVLACSSLLAAVSFCSSFETSEFFGPWHNSIIAIAVLGAGGVVSAFIIFVNAKTKLTWKRVSSNQAGTLDKILKVVGLDSRVTHGLIVLQSLVLFVLAIVSALASSVLSTAMKKPPGTFRQFILPMCTSIVMLPGVVLAARQLAEYLSCRNIRASNTALLSSLARMTALVVDMSSLQTPGMLAVLEDAVAAHVAVFVCESSTGIAAEQTVARSGLSAYNNTEAPLISSLSQLIESRENKTDLERELHARFGEMRKSVVTGVETQEDVEQLVLLLTIEYGHSVAILCNDRRYHAAVAHASVALYPDQPALEQPEPKRTIHCYCASVHSLLANMRQVRPSLYEKYVRRRSD